MSLGPAASPAASGRVLGLTPAGQPAPRLVVALGRAGAVGLLDPGLDRARALDAIAAITRRYAGPWGVRIVAGGPLTPDDLPPAVETVLLDRPADASPWAGRRVLTQVTSLDEAHGAVRHGATGLVAKGSESGGRIGDETTFVLVQQLVAAVDVPVWAQGGIGLHTAAAAVAGGAAGVVLDAQLATVRESALPNAVQQAIAAMDGSETVVVGGHRLYTRPDLAVATLDPDADPTVVAASLGGADLARDLVPIGQDASFAAELAARYRTAGGVVAAVEAAIDSHRDLAAEQGALAPDAGVSSTNGTALPIAQGPMTRVSDRAPFAASVAEAGGLPFLALALMTGDEVATLLEETVAQVGGRPWGVGILGFVPPEIRDAQLEVVRRFRPPVALIAGGRPSQAAPLEADGTRTYLHVPSPGLLDRFLKDGARRFVFEGRECGGHVGPRSSFALWEAQIERLLAHGSLDEIDVLLAGGIHDARSAAMVATAAAPLVARGARIGVLMGTAYLTTVEAVATGAIQLAFQDAALTCDATVLLETSPGHATRCVDSDYVQAFAAEKQRLVQAGVDTKTMWAELEQLNLGRLRIASKGLRREGSELVTCDVDEQRREGMFMIGQVATMRHTTTTVAELHADVTEGAVARLAAHEASAAVAKEASAPLDLAIIGMAGFFPGARDVDEYWANVLSGVDTVTEVPAERWDTTQHYDPDATTVGAGRKTPSKWGGFLSSVPFDPFAYGIPPRSVASIGPDQLLSLEVASRALADAGYAERPFDRSRTAVIFGAEAGTDLAGAYGFRAGLQHYLGEVPEAYDEHLPELTEDSFPGVLANVIAGRIANRLDLGGANYTIDAACGASLAALDAAGKELATGSADLVLCGGVDLHNGIYDYLLFASVHALSPTGRCATFDASADGIALGEGVACVVVKRLADAERDGDRIYAVVKGVGASSDGRSLGLTAPRKDGQRRALDRAYERAAVSPSDVSLVEAHGTGTVVGDRTELSTLTELFAEHGAEPGSVVVGSVKSQIGHTKCAAGLAGLIKTAKALYHGVRPPTIHVREPNEAYDPDTSPFRFADEPLPWPDETRAGGVSAFGFGGANFHAVLSSYDGDDRPQHGLELWPAELFVVRGSDRDAVAPTLERLAGALDRNDAAGRPWKLRDLAATVSSGAGPVLLAFVADDLDHLAVLVERARSDESIDGLFWAHEVDAERSDRSVAFVFPGQGSQRVGMLRDLFVAFPDLQRHLGDDRRFDDLLFPPAAFTREERARQTEALTDTRVAQPTLGLVDRAMADLLQRLGVRPDAVAGHSYGELAALCVAGALDPDELTDLSVARAESILGAVGDDPGAMAAVKAGRDEVRAALDRCDDVVLANDNGPQQTVIAGPTDAIDKALAFLADAGLSARRIPVACAFHSPVVAGADEAFARQLDKARVSAPELTVYANTTAEAYPADAAAIRQLLADQVVSPVRFADEIEAMYADGVRVFVESGPGRVLTQLVGGILGDRPHAAIACDVSGEPGVRRFLLALAELASVGVPVDVDALFAGREARLVDLGTGPVAAPFQVNGHLVRTAEGDTVPGALLPADERPSVSAVGFGASTPLGTRDEVVADYLRGLRDVVAAERDVMLQYLGADPSVMVAAPAAPTAAVQATDVADAAVSAPKSRVALTADQLMTAVLEIVSARTGYPIDMLEPDLDLEAELSIDSIKRIEILGELAERVGLPGVDDGEVDEVVIEELALLKTLREIVTWIDEHADDAPSDGGAALDDGGAVREAPVDDRPAAVPDRSLRFVPRLIDVSPAGAPGADALDGQRVMVVADAHGVADALQVGLVARGVEVIPPEASTESEPANALVYLASLTDDRPGAAVDLFTACREAALAGVGTIVAVTAGGGSFGMRPDAVDPAEAPTLDADRLAGAARGVIKTLAQEFPAGHVRVVDVSLTEEPSRLAAQVLAELVDRDGPVEIAYWGGLRQTPALAAAEPGTEPHDPVDEIHLDERSVVLVTGGARGITAKVSVALAQRYQCSIELVGRTPLPGDDEDPALADATTADELRRALIDQGELTRPADIERACRRVLADREIASTIATAREAGASVEYHSIDVRDEAALGALVADVYERHGRLDGVIHAAGVLDDKLVRDKTTESFSAVFDTKVAGARALEAALRPDVSFVVYFGSIAGVFGNRGQVDYAAANAALDLSAHAMARRLPGRVVTVDWGPWAGTGMVSPELEREYAKRGIGLIEADDGVARLLDEIESGCADPQVVVMRSTPEQLGGQVTAIDLRPDDLTAGSTPDTVSTASGRSA